MARMARIVIPNIPHHITQRGNRSQKVFFNNKDKEFYLDLLYKHAQESGLSFWAYCLMDNHVHLIAVPEREDSLAKGIGDTHKYYTRYLALDFDLDILLCGSFSLLSDGDFMDCPPLFF